MSNDNVTNAERYEQGMNTLIKMVGEEGAKVVADLGSFHPDFAHMIVAFGFGDLYSRPVLDLKQREIITLTSLITQGATDQLPFHLHAALNVGLTPEEILEIIMHCAGYAGVPKAVGALNVAREVFKQRNISVG